MLKLEIGGSAKNGPKAASRIAFRRGKDQTPSKTRENRGFSAAKSAFVTLRQQWGAIFRKRQS
jgi:hypothetical protein